MQTLTMTRLNQQTAAVLDAVERGETFKIIRHRKAVAYLHPGPPQSTAKATPKTDWAQHFRKLREKRPHDLRPTFRSASGER